jgi:hypothetical protein
MLPPTVAVFHTLNDARNEWQHWRISGAAVHSGDASSASNRAIVQMGDIWSPCSLTTSGSQENPYRSSSRRKCGCGSEKSQVPPDSQLSPSRQSKSLSPFTHRTSVNHPDELDLVDAIYDRLPRMYLSSSSGDRCWDLDEHSDLRQPYIVGAQSCTATVRQRG